MKHAGAQGQSLGQPLLVALVDQVLQAQGRHGHVFPTRTEVGPVFVPVARGPQFQLGVGLHARAGVQALAAGDLQAVAPVVVRAARGGVGGLHPLLGAVLPAQAQLALVGGDALGQGAIGDVQRAVLQRGAHAPVVVHLVVELQAGPHLAALAPVLAVDQQQGLPVASAPFQARSLPVDVAAQLVAGIQVAGEHGGAPVVGQRGAVPLRLNAQAVLAGHVGALAAFEAAAHDQLVPAVGLPVFLQLRDPHIAGVAGLGVGQQFFGLAVFAQLQGSLGLADDHVFLARRVGFGDLQIVFGPARHAGHALGVGQRHAQVDVSGSLGAGLRQIFPGGFEQARVHAQGILQDQGVRIAGIGQGFGVPGQVAGGRSVLFHALGQRQRLVFPARFQQGKGQAGLVAQPRLGVQRGIRQRPLIAGDGLFGTAGAQLQSAQRGVGVVRVLGGAFGCDIHAGGRVFARVHGHQAIAPYAPLEGGAPPETRAVGQLVLQAYGAIGHQKAF